MALIKEQFEVPGKMKTWSFGLMAVGLLAVIVGYFAYGLSNNNHDKAVFWGTLLYNSIFFTMICNAAMFFICATTLAMAGFTTTFRRVPEAISAMVPVFGTITVVLLVFIVLDNKSYIFTNG